MSERPAYTRLLLIRHGEASGNRELRYLGTTDAPLTASGEEQARRLAEALRDAPMRALYCSPLLRARGTAAALLAAEAPEIEQRLCEQDYGAWEGLTSAEARARDPQLYAEWERGLVDAPPQGESFAQLRTRSVACADALAQRHAGEVIALVSHVGPIKAIICATLGLPIMASRHMWLNPASICIVDWSLSAVHVEMDKPAGILRLFNGGPDLATLALAQMLW
ncbi:MAG TPA: histidine phosphatase family protein [Ktedonobacterales bacterium]